LLCALNHAHVRTLPQTAAAGLTANATQFAAEAASLKAAMFTHMWNGTAFCDGICTEVGGASLVCTNYFTLAFGG
jgi:hypothetical protein